MEHKLIQGGEQYLPFARSRIKALRRAGLSYASQKFDMGDALVRVEVCGRHEYIWIEAALGLVCSFWRAGRFDPVALGDDTPALVQAKDAGGYTLLSPAGDRALQQLADGSFAFLKASPDGPVTLATLPPEVIAAAGTQTPGDVYYNVPSLTAIYGRMTPISSGTVGQKSGIYTTTIHWVDDSGAPQSRSFADTSDTATLLYNQAPTVKVTQTTAMVNPGEPVSDGDIVGEPVNIGWYNWSSRQLANEFRYSSYLDTNGVAFTQQTTDHQTFTYSHSDSAYDYYDEEDVYTTSYSGHTELNSYTRYGIAGLFGDNDTVYALIAATSFAETAPTYQDRVYTRTLTLTLYAYGPKGDQAFEVYSSTRTGSLGLTVYDSSNNYFHPLIQDSGGGFAVGSQKNGRIVIDFLTRLESIDPNFSNTDTATTELHKAPAYAGVLLQKSANGGLQQNNLGTTTVLFPLPGLRARENLFGMDNSSTQYLLRKASNGYQYQALIVPAAADGTPRAMTGGARMDGTSIYGTDVIDGSIHTFDQKTGAYAAKQVFDPALSGAMVSRAYGVKLPKAS